MRVLLVEDDPTISKSIELMLTHANLNVYCTDRLCCTNRLNAEVPLSPDRLIPRLP